MCNLMINIGLSFEILAKLIFPLVSVFSCLKACQILSTFIEKKCKQEFQKMASNESSDERL